MSLSFSCQMSFIMAVSSRSEPFHNFQCRTKCLSVENENLFACNVSFLISSVNPQNHCFFPNSLFIYHEWKTLGDFSKQSCHFHDNMFEPSLVNCNSRNQTRFSVYSTWWPAAQLMILAAKTTFKMTVSYLCYAKQMAVTTQF